MKLEIDLPERVAVMTLPEVTFFPKVMMPLYIFEPRYRSMLRTSLEGNRMFAVAGLNPLAIPTGLTREPAYNVATIGIIRGCKTQDDGTSQLILQGLSRIHLDEIFEDQPYRVAAITPLDSTRKTDRLTLIELQNDLFGLVKRLAGKKPEIPPELLNFIETMEDPGGFADLVAYTFVEDPFLKQSALEALRVENRFELLINALS